MLVRCEGPHDVVDDAAQVGALRGGCERVNQLRRSGGWGPNALLEYRMRARSRCRGDDDGDDDEGSAAGVCNCNDCE